MTNIGIGVDHQSGKFVMRGQNMFGSLKVICGIPVAFAVFLILGTQWLRPAKSAAVETERQVEVTPTDQMSPVAATEVRLGSTVVQPGRMLQQGRVERITPFQAGDDWIQNLTLHLYNRTNKTIVFAEIIFLFRESGSVARSGRGFDLELGRIPPSAPGGLRPQPSDRQPISFLPGQTMVVHLGDYIEQIRRQVEPVLPVAASTHLRISLVSFYFADGMLYRAGAYRSADPQNPGKELLMSRDYFPGNMNRSWPDRPDWISPAGARKK